MENFTGKDDSPTIEEYVKQTKSVWEKNWKDSVWLNFRDEAYEWYFSLDDNQLSKLDTEFERVLLNKWSQTRKKENETHKELFSMVVSLLQVHGLIQKEKIIVSINPSCKHNFMNVKLVKKSQVPAKHIENTQADDKDVQVYKDLKISMDKYVLHGDFYTLDMDNMDVVLGYPWMEFVGIININVQKKFLKLWYKKKKITLQDISINKQVDSMKVDAEDVPGTDISDDETLMIDNPTQTETEAEKDTGADTSDEGSAVEVILEDKTPQQGELNKKTPWVKNSTYHHPHHPARKQPTKWHPISHKDNKPYMTDREERRSTYYTST